MRFCKISILFLLLELPVQGQTVIEGKIVSTNGEAIPKVVITAENQIPSDIFSDTSIEIREDGRYRISIESPGIYSVRIYSVFHHTFSFPLLVYISG